MTAHHHVDLGTLAPGTGRWLEIGAAGSETPTIAVHTMRGAKDGRCCALVAGVHGDEYDGMLAANEIVRELDASHLRGSIIVVPVANPLAFRGRIRTTPEDGKDLNRVFPGKRDGTVTERLADLLCDGVFAGADLAFSLHGGTTTGSLMPWIEFLEAPDEVGRATLEAAKASNFPDLIALPYLPGVLQTALAERKIPTIEGEVGGRGVTERSNVEYYKQRIRDVLVYLEILPGEKRSCGGERIWRLHTIAAEESGILITTIELGADVTEGQSLGRILDGMGEAVAEVRAPAAGRIASLRRHAGIKRGDTVCILWLATDASNTGHPVVR